MYGSVPLSSFGPPIRVIHNPQSSLQEDLFMVRYKKAKNTLRYRYAALATVVEPQAIEPVILDDPDDDAVLACAIAARSRIIASGDRHLLELREWQGVRILTGTELLSEIAEQEVFPSE
jgi:predicted nucleic acid-binding protein